MVPDVCFELYQVVLLLFRCVIGSGEHEKRKKRDVLCVRVDALVQRPETRRDDRDQRTYLFSCLSLRIDATDVSICFNYKSVVGFGSGDPLNKVTTSTTSTTNAIMGRHSLPEYTYFVFDHPLNNRTRSIPTRDWRRVFREFIRSSVSSR